MLRRGKKLPKGTWKDMQKIVSDTLPIQRALNDLSFYEFFKYFWSEITSDLLVDNWHVEYLCNELQFIAERVGKGKKKQHDLIINIPPGTSKTSIVMKVFPVWCWTRWYWMRMITSSYSQVLSLESGEASRDIVRSDKFKQMYPELSIKTDKDVKSNFKIVKTIPAKNTNYTKELIGGNRYSTSVGGSVTGFHGHILIIDDPLNPNEAVSEKILSNTNYWIDQVISTRKIDKEVTPTILIMQRLHQKDPSGHLLGKEKENIKHICLPADISEYGEQLQPQELSKYYIDGLLDPKRLGRLVLKELKTDLGQYGYAGQIGQKPTPPGGGMFKVNNISIMDNLPLPHEIKEIVRFWDKAGTKDGGAYTAGVKIAKLDTGKFLVIDVVRGQWSTDERERIIRQTAEADGKDCRQGIEQEPGSGGKESAENTIRMLAGYNVFKELPKGDKIYRADPWSVQVNNGNVFILRGKWNNEFLREHEYFPFSEFKDQVDAAGAAFSSINAKKTVRTW